MLIHFFKSFEEKFRYDEHGLPRVWKPEDDIDTYFKSAREDTLLLIPIFAKIDLGDETVDVESTDVRPSATRLIMTFFVLKFYFFLMLGL